MLEYLLKRGALHRRLVFTWAKVTTFSDGRRDASPPSEVTLTLRSQGAGTALKLEHSAISIDALKLGFRRGWNAALTTLQASFEPA